MSYSWGLQAANDKNGQSKRSDAIIFLSKQATITYVRPNLSFNGHSMGGGAGDTELVAGPVNMWDYDKGFLVQSMNPELYGLNFPTTGMDGLYFDLLIEGVDADELTWEPVTHEGITATVTRIEANDYWIPKDNQFPPIGSYNEPNYPNGTEVVTRVTLTGPQARSQWDNDHPGGIRVPKLPQKFELVGKDRDGYEVVKYGFELKQWFVIRKMPGTGRYSIKGYRYEESLMEKDRKKNPKRYSYANSQAWCESLGYRLPHIRDLTNAQCGHTMDTAYHCKGAVSATPTSPFKGAGYQRRIGAGMTGEWGDLTRYRIGLYGYLFDFWTDDTRYSDNPHPFVVDIIVGGISTNSVSIWSSSRCIGDSGYPDSYCQAIALCVTP
ncbi:hypothetical protein [Gilliamella intestini]|uniref:Uncharacterized protein n=1 Tax=Gilliamella intestini TaxID=1798183 RepID=A0A1C4BRV7_9GAMM|nr:hypothetical protein [Gilliamella intestini]SCC09452.1 hypothetical protein GA0061080_10248 [Gilliamella intestini]